MTWDCENRLSSAANSGETLQFKYDYMSRRVEKKTLSGEVVTKNLHFVYDGYKLIEVLDGLSSNSVLQKIVWNGETPLSITDTALNQTYYYVLDANKNVSELIDASGTVVAHYEYSPFGKIISQSGSYSDENPIRFSSEYFDDELGLVYYNHRYYSPELGRWTNKDPIEEKGGINLYGMCGNSPANNTDRLGALWGAMYNEYVAPLQRRAADYVISRLSDYPNAAKAVAFVSELHSRLAGAATSLDPDVAIPAMARNIAGNYDIARSTGSSVAGAGYYSAAMAANPLTGFAEAWDGKSYDASNFGEEMDALSRAGSFLDAFGQSLLFAAPLAANTPKVCKPCPGKVLAPESGTKFDVGIYDKIRGAPGLDAHHVGQKAVMQDFISGYEPADAPSILVPKVGHTIRGPNGIVSRSTKGFSSARDVVARDVRELQRVYPDIPNSKLQELIQLNKDLYPEIRRQ
jgi:RHS repeat-associated protein